MVHPPLQLTAASPFTRQALHRARWLSGPHLSALRDAAHCPWPLGAGEGHEMSRAHCITGPASLLMDLPTFRVPPGAWSSRTFRREAGPLHRHIPQPPSSHLRAHFLPSILSHGSFQLPHAHTSPFPRWAGVFFPETNEEPQQKLSELFISKDEVPCCVRPQVN